MELLAQNSLSDANLVAPYKFTGFEALSVERATTLRTPAFVDALITFMAPLMFVFMHSAGLYSAVGTILVAAACTT